MKLLFISEVGNRLFWNSGFELLEFIWDLGFGAWDLNF
ncbi:hypothetical protein D1BOALGB6SA_143 [Olavius sp. associated proteobacterium Delta 1]|nr:hypothetical protein D1BOALGB6SA_143 [Olavius sp. associated proteobacterium Delta 1]